MTNREKAEAERQRIRVLAARVIMGAGYWVGPDSDAEEAYIPEGVIELLSKALSQSESDALERAAALVGCYDYWNDSSGPLDLAQRIRALKPPVPQGGSDGR